MAKLWEKFTVPFRESRIPFLLAEVLTNGQGEMVDLVCRFANGPAAALLRIPAEELRGLRFTRGFPGGRLEDLEPLQTVAFSGSTASFSYTTAAGTVVTVTCYQPMYGLAACLLEPAREEGSPPPAAPSPETLPGASAVLELSRGGLRCLSFNQRLCQLTGWPRKTLLNRFAGDFSAAVAPEDWPDLLQALLDAAREARAVDHDFRLLCSGREPLWVNLRGELLSAAAGSATFQTALQDIDCQRRDHVLLAETLSQLETARGELASLFDNLPLGCCLLRLPAAGGAEPLRVSRGLADLLGCPEPELLRLLTADPQGRVLAADREALSAAAVRARASGTPLRHVCRILHSEGGVLWAALEAVWQPQADGSTLLYVTCTDVTREKKAESELRFQSQLCDLLLDRSHIVSFDYDPARDTARVESRDAAGRRTARTVPGYVETLPESNTVHPEDRKRMAAAVKRVSARPGTETLEYRGDYDGQGWRWYRVSWVSLFDGKGNVYRLLGKAEDISDRKAAAERFRDLTLLQKQQSRKALCFARLDLTANQLLDARGSSRHLTRVLFGNTAEECIFHVGENVPSPETRAQFHDAFRRAALLDAFQRGVSHFRLEHPFIADAAGRRVWARSMLELAQNPETRHVEAFCCTLDAGDSRQRDQALLALASLDYAFVLTVDAATGACRSFGDLDGEPLPPGTAYRALAARFLSGQAPSRQRTALRRALRLETVTAALETAAAYTLPCPGDRAGVLRWTWLDRDQGLLLLTGRRPE